MVPQKSSSLDYLQGSRSPTAARLPKMGTRQLADDRCCRAVPGRNRGRKGPRRWAQIGASRPRRRRSVSNDRKTSRTWDREFPNPWASWRRKPTSKEKVMSTCSKKNVSRDAAGPGCRRVDPDLFGVLIVVVSKERSPQ